MGAVRVPPLSESIHVAMSGAKCNDRAATCSPVLNTTTAVELLPLSFISACEWGRRVRVWVQPVSTKSTEIANRLDVALEEKRYMTIHAWKVCIS